MTELTEHSHTYTHIHTHTHTHTHTEYTTALLQNKQNSRIEKKRLFEKCRASYICLTFLLLFLKKGILELGIFQSHTSPPQHTK